MTTWNGSVAASTDDAQETGGTMNLAATNLNANSATQGIGLRFTNITIPPGSTINSAYLTVNTIRLVEPGAAGIPVTVSFRPRWRV